MSSEEGSTARWRAIAIVWPLRSPHSRIVRADLYTAHHGSPAHHDDCATVSHSRCEPLRSARWISPRTDSAALSDGLLHVLLRAVRSSALPSLPLYALHSAPLDCARSFALCSDRTPRSASQAKRSARRNKQTKQSSATSQSDQAHSSRTTLATQPPHSAADSSRGALGLAVCASSPHPPPARSCSPPSSCASRERFQNPPSQPHLLSLTPLPSLLSPTPPRCWNLS